MATYEHPMTGVALNDITIKRKQLTLDEAITAHILRQQGETFTDVVQRLGTNMCDHTSESHIVTTIMHCNVGPSP